MNGVILTQEGGAMNGNLMMIGYMVVIMVIMYFIMIKPQKKEKERVESMLKSLEVGDIVLTTSGFYGVIIDISDDTVIVEFGSNKNCRIVMQKSAIAQCEKPEK